MRLSCRDQALALTDVTLFGAVICRTPTQVEVNGPSSRDAFVCVEDSRVRVQMNGVCRRWVLADLAFVIPLTSYILPMLNYSKELRCLKLANNTLLRWQRIRLCQHHIFIMNKTWMVFSILSVGTMMHFLRYYSFLYLVENRKINNK